MFPEKLPEEIENILKADDIWWQHGQSSTMSKFLTHYTLHDSYWVSINYEHGGLCQLAIQFDVHHVDVNTVKLDLPISAGGRYAGESVYVLLRFLSVHQILSSHGDKYVIDKVINNASTAQLTIEQRTKWLEMQTALSFLTPDTNDFLFDEDVHCTIFEGTATNHLHFIHSAKIYFLALRTDGSPLHLPHL